MDMWSFLLLLSLVQPCLGKVDFNNETKWEKVTVMHGSNFNDYFGSAVALDSNGMNVAISSYNGSRSQGKVEFYKARDEYLTTKTWNQTDVIEHDIASLNGQTQIAFSKDGKYFVLARDFQLQVYHLENKEWNMMIEPDRGDALSKTILDLDISRHGDVLAIATYEFGNGQVEIYQRNNTDDKWSLFGSHIPTSGDNSKTIKISLSQKGDKVAFSEESEEGSRIVRAFYYDEMTLEWVQLGDTLTETAPLDAFGKAVILSEDGMTLAVSAPFSDVMTEEKVLVNAGSVHIYQFNQETSNWIKLEDVLMGQDEYDSFGNSIDFACNGTIIAVGNAHNLQKAQYVSVFQYSDSDWIQVGQSLKSDVFKDYFGFALSLSENGKVLALGAPGTAKNAQMRNSGLVTIYKYGIEKKEEVVPEPEVDEEIEIIIKVNLTSSAKCITQYHLSLLITFMVGFALWF